MGRFRRQVLSASVLVLGAPAWVGAAPGEVSPAADTVGMTTIDLVSGAVTHCDFNQPDSTGNAASQKSVKVGFVSMRIDSCVWGDARDSNGEGDRWTLYRQGADIACLVETGAAAGIQDPGPGAYANYARQKGLGDVQPLAEDMQQIGGKAWRHALIQGQLPARPPAVVGSVHRSAIWAWYGKDKLATLTCYGPSAAMQGNIDEIQSVASSLRIVP